MIRAFLAASVLVLAGCAQNTTTLKCHEHGGVAELTIDSSSVASDINQAATAGTDGLNLQTSTTPNAQTLEQAQALIELGAVLANPTSAAVRERALKASQGLCPAIEVPRQIGEVEDLRERPELLPLPPHPLIPPEPDPASWP